MGEHRDCDHAVVHSKELDERHLAPAAKHGGTVVTDSHDHAFGHDHDYPVTMQAEAPNVTEHPVQQGDNLSARG